MGCIVGMIKERAWRQADGYNDMMSRLNGIETQGLLGKSDVAGYLRIAGLCTATV